MGIVYLPFSNVPQKYVKTIENATFHWKLNNTSQSQMTDKEVWYNDSLRLLVVHADKNLCDPGCDVTCVSATIQDGGQLTDFDYDDFETFQEQNKISKPIQSMPFKIIKVKAGFWWK
jgi:hypothetical protein